MSQPLRVVLADDHAVVRTGYRRLLELEDDMQVVADFSDNLAEELDFRLEAQSMDAWISHLRNSPLGRNIRVPDVHWEFTTEKVLTMERVSGVRIDDVANIRKKGFDGTELVKALLFSVFEGGLRHGLFHGDLHAGNLLVDDEGRDIVGLDVGDVVELSWPEPFEPSFLTLTSPEVKAFIEKRAPRFEGR